MRVNLANNNSNDNQNISTSNKQNFIINRVKYFCVDHLTYLVYFLKTSVREQWLKTIVKHNESFNKGSHWKWNNLKNLFIIAKQKFQGC